MNLQVDPARNVPAMPRTGIYVRAEGPDGSFTSADIGILNRDSLLAWLQHGEERNPNYLFIVVLQLLGHTIPAELVATQGETA